jgi:hypothetical protein
MRGVRPLATAFGLSPNEWARGLTPLWSPLVVPAFKSAAANWALDSDP